MQLKGLSYLQEYNIHTALGFDDRASILVSTILFNTILNVLMLAYIHTCMQAQASQA